jgi:hypothetical protein
MPSGGPSETGPRSAEVVEQPIHTARDVVADRAHRRERLPVGVGQVSVDAERRGLRALGELPRRRYWPARGAATHRVAEPREGEPVGRGSRPTSSSSRATSRRARRRAEPGSRSDCIAGALAKGVCERLPADAGFEAASVTFTHEMTDRLHGAIVRATKPAGAR